MAPIWYSVVLARGTRPKWSRDRGRDGRDGGNSTKTGGDRGRDGGGHGRRGMGLWVQRYFFSFLEKNGLDSGQFENGKETRTTTPALLKELLVWKN